MPRHATQPPASRYTRLVNDVCAELGAEDQLQMTKVNDRICDLAQAEPEDAVLRALANASDYAHVGEDRSPQGAYGPYTPMLVIHESAGRARTSAPPLGQVGVETLEIWKSCALDADLHPLVRSRLADLLWARRHDSSGRWFEVAINEYVALAATSAEFLDREAGLARAANICAESGHPGLLPPVLDRLSALVRDALARGGLFGVVGRSLQVLVDNKHPCAELLDDAEQQHGTDPHNLDVVLLLKRQASQSLDEQRILDHQRVQAFAGAADAAVGLLRLAHLERARSIAREAGLNGEVERLSGMMERTSIEGDFQRVEASVKIDKQAVDDFIADTLGSGGLADALRRLGRTQMVADPDQATEAVAAAAQAAPLMSLCTVLSVGDGGAVTEIPSGTSERLAYALGHDAAMSIQMYTHLFGKPVLDALQRQHNPTAEAIANHFASTGIPGHLARRVGLSYTHWASGDFESAVSVLWPVLEPAVRGVCSAAGITTTETRVRSSGELPTGGVRALRPLLDELGAQLPPAMTRCLIAVLVDMYALNLRNRLAHGLVDELDEALYVVLLHTACVLAVIWEAVDAA